MKNTLVSDPQKNDLKKIKILGWWIFIGSSVMLLYFIFFAMQSYFWGSKIAVINVSSLKMVSTYKRLEFDHYSFVTGATGSLYYTTNSFLEQLLFNKLGNQTIFHCLFYFVIGLIIFLVVRSVSDRKTFTKKISKAFMISGVLITMLPTIIAYFEMLVGKMLMTRTGNAFRLNYHTDFSLVIPGLLIFLTAYFFKKGIELQKEQELTV